MKKLILPLLLALSLGFGKVEDRTVWHAVGLYSTPQGSCGDTDRFFHEQYRVRIFDDVAYVNYTEWRVSEHTPEHILLSYWAQRDAYSYMELDMFSDAAFLKVSSSRWILKPGKPPERELCSDIIVLEKTP